MIILFRHGKTRFNRPPERFRGNSDVPLLSGEKVAIRESAIDILRLGKPVEKIYYSPTARTSETAEIANEVIKSKCAEMGALRDWNYGALTGERVDENLAYLKEYEREKPDEKLPGGESYNQFLDRLIPAVEKAIDEDGPDAIVVLVTHNRVIRTILAWVKAGRSGKQLDYATLDAKKDPVLPGHMRVLEVS